MNCHNGPFLELAKIITKGEQTNSIRIDLIKVVV
jgi:hypothetical protein